MKPEQGNWLQRALAELDRADDTLPPAVRKQLDEARRRALAGEAVPHRWWRTPGLAWGGAGAASVAGAVLAVLMLAAPPATDPAVPATADLDLLTDPDFELLLEDPAFYVWVASQADTAGSGAADGDSA